MPEWQNHYFVRIILLICILMAVGISLAQVSPAEKRVLLIMSYHPDYQMTFEKIDGITAGLAEAGFERPSLVLDIEFMDAKRFYSEELVSTFYERLANKLAKLPSYDLILTADDIATKSAVQRRIELFGNVPIVFFSVNDIAFAIEQDHAPMVTGVIETPSIRETMELAIRLSPGQPLIVVSDVTPTGQSMLSYFREQVDGELLTSTIVLSLANMTFNELKIALSSYSRESSLILLTAFRDKTGVTKSLDKQIQMIVSSFPGRFYYLWQLNALGQGVLGGIVISHFEQGKMAASLAASILKGEPTATLRVERKSPNVSLFDYQQVERYGITLSDLPPNTMYVNKPAGFTFSKEAVYTTGAILIMLMIIGMMLFVAVTRFRHLSTSLRVNEEYYRSIFENSLYGIAVAGKAPGFKFKEVNDSWCRLIGYTKDELLEKMGIADVTLSDDIPESIELMKKMISREITQFVLEKRYRTKYGKIIDVIAFVKGIYCKDGQYIGSTASVMDITKRKLAEKALRRAKEKTSQQRERLAQLSNIQIAGVMATSFAHELNQPLAAIENYAQAALIRLESEPDNVTKLRGLLVKIRTQAHSSGEVIINLRAMVKQKEINKTPVDLNALLNETVELVENEIEQCGCRINVLPVQEIPKIEVDRIQIQQVVLNLIRNAIDASCSTDDEDKKLVLIELNLNEKNEIEVSVTDRGKGISISDSEKLFESFYTTKNTGMGIGLSICQIIIEAHGGKIWYSSNPAGGAVFRFSMPVKFGKV